MLSGWAWARDLPQTDEELLTAYSPIEAAVEAAVEAEHPGDLSSDVMARSMRRLGEHLGAEVSDADADRLARSVPDRPAFPDSHDALVALGERYKLIILSNVGRVSFAGSNRRLDEEFTSIVTAQDVASGGAEARHRRDQSAGSVINRGLRSRIRRFDHRCQGLITDVRGCSGRPDGTTR